MAKLDAYDSRQVDVKETKLSNEQLARVIWVALMNQSRNRPDRLAEILFNSSHVSVAGVPLLAGEVSNLGRELTNVSSVGNLDILLPDQQMPHLADWLPTATLMDQFAIDGVDLSPYQYQPDVFGRLGEVTQYIKSLLPAEEPLKTTSAPSGDDLFQQERLDRSFKRVDPEMIASKLGVPTSKFELQKLDGRPAIMGLGRVVVASLLANPDFTVRFDDEEEVERVKLAEIERQRRAAEMAAFHAEQERLARERAREIDQRRQLNRASGTSRSAPEATEVHYIGQTSRALSEFTEKDWWAREQGYADYASWIKYDPLYVMIDPSRFSDYHQRAIVETFNTRYAFLVNLALKTMSGQIVSEYVGAALRGENLEVQQAWLRQRKAFLEQSIRALVKIGDSAKLAFTDLVACQAEFTKDGLFFLHPEEAAVIGHAANAFFHGLEMQGSKLKVMGEGDPLFGQQLRSQFDGDLRALRR